MKRLFVKYGATVCLVAALFLATDAQQDSKPYQGQPNQQEQGGNKRGEKIEALKIAFITQQLNLTPEEAQKFWPLFNQYEADLANLRKSFYKGQDPNTFSADQHLDFMQKKLDLQKSYLSQFETAIGKQKANILYGLEEKFRQRLQEIQQQRQQQKRWGNGY